MSIGNRVEQTTTSTGTGSIELLAPPSGRRSFLQEFGAGATVRYAIETEDGSAWEIGEAALNAGPPETLGARLVVRSSNADQPVNFAVGLKRVYVPASDADWARFGGGLPTSGGTANALTLSYRPGVARYVNGMEFWFVAGAANTGPATLDAGAGPLALRKGNGTADLASGDIRVNHVIGVKYDAGGGGRFRVVHPYLDATSEVEPTGTVKMYAGAAAPAGYLPCQGQAVSRTTYAALFAVIGTGFGAGDGSTTFNLPDLRDRVPMGASASRALGSTGGSLSATTASAGTHTHGASSSSAGAHSHGGGTGATTLTTMQMPSHTHNVPATFINSYPSVYGYIAEGGSSIWSGQPTTSTGGGNAHTHSIGSDGTHSHAVTVNSDGAHTHTVATEPARQTLNFIIKT